MITLKAKLISENRDGQRGKLRILIERQDIYSALITDGGSVQLEIAAPVEELEALKSLAGPDAQLIIAGDLAVITADRRGEDGANAG